MLFVRLVIASCPAFGIRSGCLSGSFALAMRTVFGTRTVPDIVPTRELFGVSPCSMMS
jgi:hypothetical protein